jgi:sn-glycerol 3-phosphate transport system substrate-binding protein
MPLPVRLASTVSASRSRRELLATLLGTLASASCGRPTRPLRDGSRIVVTFWYAFGDVVRKVLLELVERYNQSQSRVLVRPVHQGDYFEALAKLRTAIAAGAAPPLAHVVLEVLPYLARAGVLEPLDGYEGAGELGLVPALSQRGSFGLGAAQETYGVPFNRSTPIAYCNARLFEQDGAHVPTTWGELAQVARSLTRRSSGSVTRWGFEVPISWWYWVALVGQAGGHLVEPDGKLSLGGPAGEAALEFWQRLVRTDRVMRPPPGGDYQAWQSTSEGFLQQRIAMMWSSTAFLRYLEASAPFPIVAAPLPRASTFSVPTGGTMFVLVRSAPDEEKQGAFSFVRWMCEPQQAIDWCTRTGYMPITRRAVESLGDSGFYMRHPNDRVAYDQLAHAQPWPWAPDLFRVERDIVEPLLQEAVLTGRDPHEVMQEAREQAAEPA